MNSFTQSYAKQLFKHFELYSHWTPYGTVNLGDIGVLSHGTLFEYRDTLTGLFNISFTTRSSKQDGKAGKISNHMSFSTAGQTQVDFLPKGQAGLVNCGIDVSFKKENSFFFNLSGVQVIEIADQLSMAKKIMELYWQDRWDDNWVVVTQCIQAESSIILGSMTSGNSIRLEAKTDIPSVDLSNAQLEFSIRGAHSLDLDVVAQHDLRPLLKISKIRRKGLFADESFGFTEDTKVSDNEYKSIVKARQVDPNDFFEFAELA